MGQPQCVTVRAHQPHIITRRGRLSIDDVCHYAAARAVVWTLLVHGVDLLHDRARHWHTGLRGNTVPRPDAGSHDQRRRSIAGLYPIVERKQIGREWNTVKM